MEGCNIKITGLEVTRESHKRRAWLQELVEVLGARVAHKDSRRPWTHVVYVNASLVEAKTLEIARRRQIPVVAVQWIFDSYKANARLPTDSYVVESVTSPSAAAAPEAPCFFDTAVLAGHRLLISPSALG